MQLSDLFLEFINYATLERCLELTTIQWYKNSIKIYFKYLRNKVLSPTLESLSTETLRGFFISLRQQGNSPRTTLNLMQAIKAFCTYLVKKNHLPSNPFATIEKPKLKRNLPEFLTEEETRELLRTAINNKQFYTSRRVRDIAIIALFIFTGIRRKELLNLKLADINFERGTIKVSAKNKERLIPLNETVISFMKDYIKVRPYRTVDNLFVSTNRRNSALTSEGLADVFKELKRKANIQKNFSPQILRHTFCTLMLRNGVNLRDIQLLAGHSDISTTARFYLGCDDKQLKQAVNKHPLNI